MYHVWIYKVSGRRQGQPVREIELSTVGHYPRECQRQLYEVRRAVLEELQLQGKKSLRCWIGVRGVSTERWLLIHVQ